MKRWIGAAVVAGVLALAVPASAATAAPLQIAKHGVEAGNATDFSAHRYHRRYDGHRSHTAHTIEPTTTRDPTTIGRIPIPRLRRSCSVSDLGRSGGDSRLCEAKTLMAGTLPGHDELSALRVDEGWLPQSQFLNFQDLSFHGVSVSIRHCSQRSGGQWLRREVSLTSDGSTTRGMVRRRAGASPR